MSSAKEIYKNIPTRISDSQVIDIIESKDLGSSQLRSLKSIAESNDKTLSEWFDVSEKTLQNYRSAKVKFNTNFKEKLLLLLSLYKRGVSVFGSKEDFNDWLKKPNFQFDNKRPADYFKTISGIRYIESRLIGMTYGDNV